MSTQRRMVVCAPCRPKRAGCCMWAPLDTSLVIIFLLFLGLLIGCMIMITLPYGDTSHFLKTSCRIHNIQWTGLGYCTNCYTEDTGTQRKKREIDVQAVEYTEKREVVKQVLSYTTTEPMDLYSKRRLRRASRRSVCYEDLNPPSFPCVKVTVNYTTPDMDSEMIGAVLHAYIEDVYKYPDCSFSSCKDSYDENEAAITVMSNEWQKFYLSGQPIDCYYNPYRKSQVLTTVISYESMLHSLIWPSVIMCGCVMFFILRRFYHCWHLANQVREKPQGFDQKTNNLQRRQQTVENGRVRGGSGNDRYAIRNGPNAEHHWAISSPSTQGQNGRSVDAGPSVHLEQVSMIDNAPVNSTRPPNRNASADITDIQDIELPNAVPESSSFSDEELSAQGRKPSRATPVIAPPLQFRTGTDVSDSPYSTPRENTNIRYKNDKPVQRKESAVEEFFTQGQTVSYMDNGIIKYSFNGKDNKASSSSSSVSWSRHENTDKKLSLPPPKPQNRLSITTQDPLDTSNEPKTKTNALPPIKAVNDGNEQNISQGRLTRKQRAEKLREEKRKQRQASSDSDERNSSVSNTPQGKPVVDNINLDTAEGNDSLTDGDTKILAILKALDPDAPKTPREPPKETITSPRGHLNAGYRDDTLDDPLAKVHSSNRGPDVRPKSRLGNRPLNTPRQNEPRPERPKSPRVGHRTEHRLSTAEAIDSTSNPFFPKVNTNSSKDSVLGSEIGNSKMNNLLKFSRHTDGSSNNMPPDVKPRKPESRQLDPISNRRNSKVLGAPVATGNLKPLRPIPTPRQKLNININIPDISDRNSLQRAPASAKALDELYEDSGMPTARTVIEERPETPVSRPKSRSTFHDNQTDDESTLAINYRPQNMYGDITDSDSLPSHQSHADDDTQYMDAVGNVTSQFYDDRHIRSKDNRSVMSEESFATRYMRRTEEENGNGYLPPLESLNMRILEYVANGGPTNSLHSGSVTPESWGGSKASHISYSPNTADALSDGEDPIPNPEDADNIVIKTSDGKSIALPAGAKVIPGGGGLTELNVQNGDDTFVLPIPENAQYIVYEYIEEGSTTASCSTCCDDDQCSKCGGEIPSPIPNRDDLTMEDL